jgi:hypothetical protein
MKKLLLFAMIFWSFWGQSQTYSLSTVDQLKKFKAKGELAKLSGDKKSALFKAFFEEEIKRASSLESEIKNFHKTLSSFDLILQNVNDSWKKLYTEKNWANTIGRSDMETLSQTIRLLSKKDNDIEFFVEKYKVRRDDLRPITQNTEDYFQILFDTKMPTSVFLKVDDKLQGIAHLIDSDLSELTEVYYSIQRLLNEIETHSLKTEMEISKVIEINRSKGINKEIASSPSFLNLVKTVKSLGMYSFTPKISAQ